MTRLVLLHPMDPRGCKLGGIETHVRLLLAHHPKDVSILHVGVDEIGDSAIGCMRSLDVDGRRICFLPVLRVDAADINTVARDLRRSLTLRFALAAARHAGAIARAAGPDSSCEVERTELAVLPRLIGRPCLLVLHDEGPRQTAGDSLLRRHRLVHRASERLAFALAHGIVAVTPSIAARVAAVSRQAAARTQVMPVAIDTHRFAPSPFPPGRTFRVCVAGRLDVVKDPELMVASLARAAERLAAEPAGRFDRLAFDYAGPSDLRNIPGFEGIAAFTTRHGSVPPSAVATLMRSAHAGLITSHFEGMPCYLLEMLACGRPVAAVAMPQFEPLIRPGLSGRFVTRCGEGDADAMAAALHALAGTMDALDPGAIAALVRPYAAEVLMERHFAWHAALASGAPQPSASARAA